MAKFAVSLSSKKGKNLASYFIDKPNKGVLTLTSTLTEDKWWVIVLNVLLAVIVGYLFYTYPHSNMLYLILVAFVLISFFTLSWLRRKIKEGEKYWFDSDRQLLLLNYQTYAAFEQITQLAFSVTTGTDDDGEPTETFFLKLKTRNHPDSLKLYASRLEVANMAAEIASITQINYQLIMNGQQISSVKGTPFYDAFKEKEDFDGFMEKFKSYTDAHLQDVVDGEQWIGTTAYKAAKETLRLRKTK